MNSRYDFMRDGNTFDEESNSYFPDPLSLQYSDFTLSEVPSRDTMTLTKIKFLWKEVENKYGSPCWDDIILTLNGISHKNFLKPGDDVYLPELQDIINSFNKRR